MHLIQLIESHNSVQQCLHFGAHHSICIHSLPLRCPLLAKDPQYHIITISYHDHTMIISWSYHHHIIGWKERVVEEACVVTRWRQGNQNASFRSATNIVATWKFSDFDNEISHKYCGLKLFSFQILITRWYHILKCNIQISHQYCGKLKLFSFQILITRWYHILYSIV